MPLSLDLNESRLPVLATSLGSKFHMRVIFEETDCLVVTVPEYVTQNLSVFPPVRLFARASQLTDFNIIIIIAEMAFILRGLSTSNVGDAYRL